MLTTADRHSVDEAHRQCVGARREVGHMLAALRETLTNLEAIDRQLCEAIYRNALVAQSDDAEKRAERACPRCHGQGRVIENHSLGLGVSTGNMGACPDCHGTGEKPA